MPEEILQLISDFLEVAPGSTRKDLNNFTSVIRDYTYVTTLHRHNGELAFQKVDRLGYLHYSFLNDKMLKDLEDFVLREGDNGTVMVYAESNKPIVGNSIISRVKDEIVDAFEKGKLHYSDYIPKEPKLTSPQVISRIIVLEEQSSPVCIPWIGKSDMEYNETTKTLARKGTTQPTEPIAQQRKSKITGRLILGNICFAFDQLPGKTTVICSERYYNNYVKGVNTNHFVIDKKGKIPPVAEKVVYLLRHLKKDLTDRESDRVVVIEDDLYKKTLQKKYIDDVLDGESCRSKHIWKAYSKVEPPKGRDDAVSNFQKESVTIRVD